MKKDQLRAEVAATLKALGFKSKQYRWSGCTLDIVVNGEFRSLRFPAGTSRRALAFEMGRLTGWVEMLNERAATQVEIAKAGMAAAAAVSANGKLIANGHHKEASP